MDLTADLLIVNNYNKYVVVNNEVLREIYIYSVSYQLSTNVHELLTENVSIIVTIIFGVLR